MDVSIWIGMMIIVQLCNDDWYVDSLSFVWSEEGEEEEEEWINLLVEDDVLFLQFSISLIEWYQEH
jgi:hypothetical protein